MRKEAITRFLKPDWKKALVLVILVSVALAGHVQSWVFSGKDMGVLVTLNSTCATNGLGKSRFDLHLH